jgi:hypothetical protein
VSDVICFGDTSVCIADDNDIYIWGLDFTRTPIIIIDEPQLICHFQDNNQMISDHENEGRYVIDKIHIIQKFGLVIKSSISKNYMF